MTTVISGDTGVSQCQPGSVSADDLAAGVGVITNGALQSVPGAGLTVGSIPAGVRRITVVLNGVSNDGSGTSLLRLGTSGGLITSGYASDYGRSVHGSTCYVGHNTTGILLSNNSAAEAVYGVAEFVLADAATNLWFCSFQGFASSTAILNSFGFIALSGPVTQLALLPFSGTFDAGSMSVSWEF
jgi:hypothetical protein